MDTAQRLLASEDMPVTDVCLAVGYTSMGTFSSRFAAQMGRAPSEYRREARRFVAPIRGWRVYRVPSCYLSFWQLPQF
jgi:AraC-like DNA-binding protein